MSEHKSPYDELNDRLNNWRSKWHRRPSKWFSTPMEIVALVLGVLTFVAVVATGIVGYQNWLSLETSNATSRDAYLTSNRAYVTVNELDVQPVRNEQGKVVFWRATPVLMNSGNTPTKNLWWTALAGDTRGITIPAMDFADGTHAPELTTSGPDGPRIQTFEELQSATRNRFTLGPRQEARPLGLSTPLPLGYVSGIVSRRARVYIHGTVFYQDFISAKGHVTRYCFSLWHNEAVTGPGIAYSGCGGNTNCVDEECEGYERLKILAEGNTVASTRTLD